MRRLALTTMILALACAAPAQAARIDIGHAYGPVQHIPLRARIAAVEYVINGEPTPEEIEAVLGELSNAEWEEQNAVEEEVEAWEHEDEQRGEIILPQGTEGAPE